MTSERRQIQPVVDLEPIPAGDQGGAAVARIVRGDDGRTPAGGLGEHPLTGRGGGVGVQIERARIRGPRNLDGAVGQIPDEHRRPAGVQPQHR